MKKVVLIITSLILVFSMVWIVDKTDKQQLDYQLEINKLKKQNKKLKVKNENELLFMDDFSSESNNRNQIENMIVKEELSEKMLAENQKVMEILFTYTDYSVRQEMLNMYITDMLKEKMINATQSIDMHDVQVDSKLVNFDAFVRWENEDKLIVLNLVNSSTKVSRVNTNLRTLVQVDYYNYDGNWKVSNIIFIDTK
ncbi:hypothetical protein [Listeria monocytogenes]|uniref:hypothetical protein n=1 Tax=Listeria monocytogenes TaxID=1639 RepID=UPI0010CFB435|nr:hypothetical protein [Listeria monocytogenes]EAD5509169.1 hypothetical protein [Listeria monocytogenes]EEO1968950.1 hypothetical protein [Listeria monocytogenes]EEO6643585.1 hypothetical protein [Listeria monocytogenes]EEO9130648.1 hypothetical protein [Listeria monocytogenes]EJQ3348408.1 hypothetical protein [Listeria monocytogenes]